MRNATHFTCRYASLALVVALVGCSGPPPAKEAVIPKVRVVPARAGMVAVEVPVVGSVVPADVSRVASSAEGMVVKFPYREGQFVEEGAVLAELRDVTLSIELEKARALFREQEQKYSELASGYREEEVAQTEARMMAADAARLLAEARLKRLEELRERSQTATTEEGLDESRFMAEQARHAHLEAKADYDMKTRGYRAELVAAAQAAMEAARHEVERLEDELKKRTITAPFAGYIVTEDVEVGEWVPLGGQVVTLARLDEVEVRVNVEEAYIDQIEVGQTVDVRFAALGNQQVECEVEFVVPRADWQQGSRSFPVVVRLENSIVNGQPLLKEGMLAKINFRGPEREAVLAHKDSIVRTTGPSLVFVVGENETVRAVEVREGLSQGDSIEITGVTDTIQPGDRLVTEGVERLRPFDQVAVLEPLPGQTPPAAGQAMKPAREPTASGGM